MIRRFALVLFCQFFCLSVAAAQPASKVPAPLLGQVQRLSELLRDSHAVLYADATSVQIVKLREDNQLALVVFTLEGFGGGNNHTQFLAAFRVEDMAYFRLLDVIPIGGKGWRAVNDLKAKVTPVKGAQVSQDASIFIDALENSTGDSTNSPSKKVTVHLLLKGGRLAEQKAR